MEIMTDRKDCSPEQYLGEYSKQPGGRAQLVLRKTKRDSFEEKMLREAQPPGILRPEAEEEYYCRFDVTGRKSLSMTFERVPMNAKHVYTIVQNILHAVDSAKEYLLREDGFLIDADRIYLDFPNYDVTLCYGPEYRVPVPKQLGKLFEVFLNRVDYREDKAIAMAYSMYMKLQEPDLTPGELRMFMEEFAPEGEECLPNGRKEERNRTGENSTVPSGERFTGAMSVTSGKEEPVFERRNSDVRGSRLKERVEYRNARREPDTKSDFFAKEEPVRREYVTGTDVGKAWYDGSSEKQSGSTQVFAASVRKKNGKKGLFDFLRKASAERASDNCSETESIKKKQKKATAVLQKTGSVWDMIPDRIPEDFLQEPYSDGGCAEGRRNSFADFEETEQRKPAVMVAENPPEWRTWCTRVLARTEENYGPMLISEKNGEEIPLLKFPFFIGSLSGYADYVIPKDTVSRFHAKLTKDETDRILIMDLNSTNGTAVNGQTIGIQQNVALADGDLLRIAGETYRFLWKKKELQESDYSEKNEN